jgi:aspartate kinase
VKALTAIQDVALISVGGPGIVGLPDVVGRTFSTTAEVRANVLLISQSSSQNDICFIVSAADAQRTVEALRKEFAQDLAHEKVEHITVDTNIAIVAVVGENMRGTPGVAGKTFNALGRENVNLIAIAQGWARQRTKYFYKLSRIYKVQNPIETSATRIRAHSVTGCAADYSLAFH